MIDDTLLLALGTAITAHGDQCLANDDYLRRLESGEEKVTWGAVKAALSVESTVGRLLLKEACKVYGVLYEARLSQLQAEEGGWP